MVVQGSIFSNESKYVKEVRAEQHKLYPVLVSVTETCMCCGGTFKDGIKKLHHIRPVRNGGGNQLWNLTVVCNDCHSKKDSMLHTLDHRDSLCNVDDMMAIEDYMETHPTNYPVYKVVRDRYLEAKESDYLRGERDKDKLMTRMCKNQLNNIKWRRACNE